MLNANDVETTRINLEPRFLNGRWTQVERHFWYVMGVRGDWKAFKQLMNLNRDQSKNEALWFLNNLQVPQKHKGFTRKLNRYFLLLGFLYFPGGIQCIPFRFVGCATPQRETMGAWTLLIPIQRANGRKLFFKVYHLIDLQCSRNFVGGICVCYILTSCMFGI